MALLFHSRLDAPEQVKAVFNNANLIPRCTGKFKKQRKGEVTIVRRCMARFWPQHELGLQPDKGPRYERSVLCSSVCLRVQKFGMRSLQTALGLIYLDGGEDWTVRW
ncbi:MAG: hypothetical protein ACSHYC_07040 [Alphaproteobacteria bacterium]